MEAPLGKPEGVFYDSIPGENGVGLRFRAEFFNIFNHPNFGNPQRHPGQPPVRPLDANAGEQPGLRRRKWRLQPPLPNRRRPLHPTRPQTSALVAQPLLALYGLKDVHGERNRSRSAFATKSLQLKKTVRNKRIISAKARSVASGSKRGPSSRVKACSAGYSNVL